MVYKNAFQSLRRHLKSHTLSRLNAIQNASTMSSSIGRNQATTRKSISELCREGQLKEAVQILNQIEEQNTQEFLESCLYILRCCIKVNALKEGVHVHANLLNCPLKPNVYVWNTLIHLYIKCGRISDAREVFNFMDDRNTFTWTTVISGYAQKGDCREALNVFVRMQQHGSKANQVTFICILTACIRILALELGKWIHAIVLKSEYITDTNLCNTLINMYAKCGSNEDALRVFDGMQGQDSVSWNVVIALYLQHHNSKEAIALFRHMQCQLVKPDKITYLNLLDACALLTSGQLGKHIHALLLTNGHGSDSFVTSTLVNMYAKCGNLDHACIVFEKSSVKEDIVLWNSMISGHVQQGNARYALHLFSEMQQDMKADKVTFLSILNVCASIASREVGKLVHTQIMGTEYESDVTLGNALVDMYAKCASIEGAREVFDRMVIQNVVSWNAILSAYTRFGSIEDVCLLFENSPVRNAVTWNTIIGGNVQQGNAEQALELYHKMLREGIEPDNTTFVNVLTACTVVKACEEGKCVHAAVLQEECPIDVYIGSALVDMYSKCGSIDEAQQIFERLAVQDVVSWSALMGGYAQHGDGRQVLQLFDQMQDDGIKPNQVTFISILTACTLTFAFGRGKFVHARLLLKAATETDILVENTIIDMYAKCGCIQNACTVFSGMSSRNVVSWNVMVAAHIQHRDHRGALETFEMMRSQDVLLDKITVLHVLDACSSLAALDVGKELHAMINAVGWELDMVICNALIDMFVKCGSTQDAWDHFQTMPSCNIISWNAVIAGYAQYGNGSKVFELFWKMQKDNIEPDDITLVSVIFACSHASLLNEGCFYFILSTQNYGIGLMVRHFACMVDLLGRAGYLDEGYDFTKSMPIEANVEIWKCLLGACRIHGEIEIAEYTVEQILKLEPLDDASFVLLSNIYAVHGIIESGVSDRNTSYFFEPNYRLQIG